MLKVVLGLLISTWTFAASATVDRCELEAADAVVAFLQKDYPQADIQKSVKDDQIIGLFDVNKTMSSFTADVIEDEFSRSLIFSEDGTDYIVMVEYSYDEQSKSCRIGEVDSGQNDQD